MKFGIFYEHQLPRPWEPGAELRLFQDALDQVELADRLGIDYAWEVEHHFLEEYSHSSAPEVFLAAASQRSRRIRLGHGIVLMPPGYNAPARVAAPTLTEVAHRLSRRRPKENNRGVSCVDMRAFRRLLRSGAPADGVRPCTEQDIATPHYSMISSARARIVDGMVSHY